MDYLSVLTKCFFIITILIVAILCAFRAHFLTKNIITIFENIDNDTELSEKNNKRIKKKCVYTIIFLSACSIMSLVTIYKIAVYWEVIWKTL